MTVSPPAMPACCPPFDVTLERRFVEGLAALLECHTGLGVYILVLANAAYDETLWSQLAPALATRHAELAARMTEALRQGRALDETDDDVLVFLKLQAIGFAHLQTMQGREAGPWTVLFNPIRALRPPRMSGMKFKQLQRAFEPAGFHFNKPFLAREIFWEGELAGRPARVLYNKFPFARLHGLLVPEPLQQLPQFLTPALHEWAWGLCADATVPGLRLGYNSYGAGASVNHLHFQSFVATRPLPVEAACFGHNGGAAPYPLPCRRFDDAEAAWAHLDQLHQRNTPYNLLYARGHLHVVPRLPQDSAALSASCSSYGWSEMAGVVTRFSRDAYDNQDAAGFEAELASFRP